MSWSVGILNGMEIFSTTFPTISDPRGHFCTGIGPLATFYDFMTFSKLR